MADQPRIAEMILESTYKVQSKYSGQLQDTEELKCIVEDLFSFGNFRIEIHEIRSTISSFRAKLNFNVHTTDEADKLVKDYSKHNNET